MTILDSILVAMYADLPHVPETERAELRAAIGRLELQREAAAK